MHALFKKSICKLLIYTAYTSVLKKKKLYVTKRIYNLFLPIGMAGELYLRMLKSMIVPLIVSSVITGKWVVF